MAYGLDWLGTIVATVVVSALIIIILMILRLSSKPEGKEGVE